MKNLTKLIFGTTILGIIGILCLINPNIESGWLQADRVQAEESDYSIAFNPTNNVFNELLDTQEVSTTLGNDISFSYSGYSEGIDVWGNLASGGYVYNSIAISGLLTLSVTYGTSNGNLTIAYGWWDETTSAIVYEVIDGSITSTSTSFDFDGYSPSFFKITASAAAQVVSMTITYSCVISENPLPTVNELTMTLSGSTYSVTDCDEFAVVVEIPETYKNLSVTSIGSQTFMSCTLLESVTIPSSVASIGNAAFFGCSSLISVNVPSTVTSLGDQIFDSCTSLETAIILSSADIPWGAFWHCTSLTSVIMSSRIIEMYAFAGCSSLISVVIPSSGIWIFAYAFQDCTSIISIYIPASVTYIGDDAFARCSLLTIYCEALSQPSGWSSTWNSGNYPVVWGYTG
jgi:hypothetical protein